ncbi:hypothetical protein ATN84_02235 [Paramesorhizobium deserti]|uniref:DUF937 domain-containing protein n=1 Tax=Paramesorhizobium deserti TaxID=1494590 RepID=A0A135HZP1_9HYPH|nr:DUF937 domain-containing protein [Paramesorhizobium deserti]KXF78628.1 hypothetical protein ATN84_02235 [Paramesorhizobium deserti]
MSLIDLFLNAQGGQNAAALARQFGLSQQQTVAALEALLPAFSQGLKRNAADPYGIGSFLQALANGDHAKYAADPARAFDPAGLQDGNGILGHLFGSKELSRAVADHAARMTGIGAETLKQMLPVIASMMMGGLAQQTFGRGNQNAEQQRTQTQAENPFGPFGQILESMFSEGPAQQRQASAGNPFGDTPWGKMLEQMQSGGAAASVGNAQQQNPFRDSPFAKIFEETLRGGTGAAPQEPPSPQPDHGAPPASGNPLQDIFSQMFETGRQTQEKYQKDVESIFDQYLHGMDRHR